jgi:MinD-like ATPase involved in chromosome partitioning or flagellar assembly
VKIISFFSDKGGVGATMFNISMAAFLAYEHNKRVCVVDTASGFRGVSEDRKFEVENSSLDDNDILSLEEKQNLIVNPLTGSKVHIHTIDTFENFKTFLSNFKNAYDFVFLDLKGISEQNFNFIMKSTSIFLISTLDDIKKDVKTYNAFSFILNNKLFLLKDLFVLMNKVNINVQASLDNTVINKFKEKQVRFIEKVLTERKRFDDYSTITGFVNRSGEITKIFEEIYDLIEQEEVIVL